jgi:hypothetical protein
LKFLFNVVFGFACTLSRFYEVFMLDVLQDIMGIIEQHGQRPK